MSAAAGESQGMDRSAIRLGWDFERGQAAPKFKKKLTHEGIGRQSELCSEKYITF
jgi:hypothetical protein